MRRRPITLTLLKNLRRQIRGSSTIKKPDKHTYWAAMTLAFYGFLRANEFCSLTAHKFSKTRTLCRGDITIAKDLAHMSVRVKASKTDQFRHSTTIQVAATRTSTCPVQAMGRYMKRTSHQCASKPLFILKGGHYLTRSLFTSGGESATYLSAILISVGRPSAAVWAVNWLLLADGFLYILDLSLGVVAIA